MRQKLGITLIETLIGLALTVIVLYAASTVFSSSSSLYQSQVADADEAQALSAGIARFSYELGLAGYRGTDLTVDTIDSRTFNGNASLTIDVGNSSDSIQVRYYEDRWTSSGSGADLKDIKFFVSNNELKRQEGTQTAESIAEDINNVKVTHYLTKDGTKLSYSSSVDATDVYGLVIAFNYATDANGNTYSDELFTVGFSNAQQN